MRLVASLLVALGAAAADPPAHDPCAGLRAPLPSVRAAGEKLQRIEEYRAAWRAVCDPRAAPVDLAALLDEAEVLAADVALAAAVDPILREAPADAASPLPGIRRQAETGTPAVDWGAFQAVLERGTAEDQRFWRSAAQALGRDGDPVWLGPAAGGARCIRLGEVAWSDVAAALERMESAGAEAYARRARELRSELLATLSSLASGPVCGCAKGDPLLGLDALAASSGRIATPMRRTLAKAAGNAAEALRAGRVHLSWLRAAREAPPSGCSPGKP